MRITRIITILLSGAMLILAGQLAVDPPEPHLAEQAQFKEVVAPTTPVAPEPTTPTTPPTLAPAPITPTSVPSTTLLPATVVIPYEEGLSMSLEFLPRTITVPVGTTVIWNNKSTRAHTVTSDTGLFKRTLLLDEYFRYTFTVRGTFPYHCDFLTW